MSREIEIQNFCPILFGRVFKSAPLVTARICNQIIDCLKSFLGKGHQLFGCFGMGNIQGDRLYSCSIGSQFTCSLFERLLSTGAEHEITAFPRQGLSNRAPNPPASAHY